MPMRYVNYIRSIRFTRFPSNTELRTSQSIDEVIDRLYALYEIAPAAERFYVPQLANFLLHGGLDKAERLELFLLEKSERSIHFAHRLFFFLNAYAPDHPYISELCGVISEVANSVGNGTYSSAPYSLPNDSPRTRPLLKAVEIQGAFAAIRFTAEQRPLEPRRPRSSTPSNDVYAPTLWNSTHPPITEIPRAYGSLAAILQQNDKAKSSSISPEPVPPVPTDLSIAHPTPLVLLQDAVDAVGTAPSSSTLVPLDSSSAPSAVPYPAPENEATTHALMEPATSSLLSFLNYAAAENFQRIRRNLSSAATYDAETQKLQSKKHSGAGGAGSPVDGSQSDRSTSRRAGQKHNARYSRLPTPDPHSVAGTASTSPAGPLSAPTSPDAGTHMFPTSVASGDTDGFSAGTPGGAPSPDLSPDALQALVPHSMTFPPRGYNPASVDNFLCTIRLVLEFSRVSAQMVSFPIENRNQELRKALDAMAAIYLPSNTLSVPLSNVHNRLVGIHSEHSFCFKTAKRAPFLVVLELIDYANAGGGPLDDDHSEDDDEARIRAMERRRRKRAHLRRMRRAQNMYNLQSERHSKEKRKTSRRSRHDKAAQALSAFSENVKGAAAEFGEVVQEKAGALGRYVKRKVDELTLTPARGSRNPKAVPLFPTNRENGEQIYTSEFYEPTSTTPTPSSSVPLVPVEIQSLASSAKSPTAKGSAAKSRAASATDTRNVYGDKPGTVSRLVEGDYSLYSSGTNASPSEQSPPGTPSPTHPSRGRNRNRRASIFFGGAWPSDSEESTSAPPASSLATLGLLDAEHKASGTGLAAAEVAHPKQSLRIVPRRVTTARALQEKNRNASRSSSHTPILSGEGDTRSQSHSLSSALALEHSDSVHSDGSINEFSEEFSREHSISPPFTLTSREDVGRLWNAMKQQLHRGLRSVRGQSTPLLQPKTEYSSLLSENEAAGNELDLRPLQNHRTPARGNKSVRYSPNLTNLRLARQAVHYDKLKHARSHSPVNYSTLLPPGGHLHHIRGLSVFSDTTRRSSAGASASHAYSSSAALFSPYEDDPDREHAFGTPGGTAMGQWVSRTPVDPSRPDASPSAFARSTAEKRGLLPETPSNLSRSYQPPEVPAFQAPPGVGNATVPGTAATPAPAARAAPPAPLSPSLFGPSGRIPPATISLEDGGETATEVQTEVSFSSSIYDDLSAACPSDVDPNGSFYSKPRRRGACSTGRRHAHGLPTTTAPPLTGDETLDAELWEGIPTFEEHVRAIDPDADYLSVTAPRTISSARKETMRLTKAKAKAKDGSTSSPIVVIPTSKGTAGGADATALDLHQEDPESVRSHYHSYPYTDQSDTDTDDDEEGYLHSDTDESLDLSRLNPHPIHTGEGGLDTAAIDPNASHTRARRSESITTSTIATLVPGNKGSDPVPAMATSASRRPETTILAAGGANKQLLVEAEKVEKPVSVVFPERWREKEAFIAKSSPYSHLPGWRLMPIIVKSDDDLRQEQFVAQLLKQFDLIFKDARVPVWMKPYDILAISTSAGIIQAVPDTISLDSLKRGDPKFTTLSDWFTRHFRTGPKGVEREKVARMNFARSLAAYSIVCYILQIKDRHNGNILVDRRGHIIHIDFGFLLTNSPGGNIGFEAAPFKLTQEFVDVLGGPRSALFNTYRKLCVQAFLAARKARQKIILQVQMMLAGNEHLPCFVHGPKQVMNGLRLRFHENLSARQCVSLVHRLIDDSTDNWRTRWYDHYQRFAQGVMV